MVNAYRYCVVGSFCLHDLYDITYAFYAYCSDVSVLDFCFNTSTLFIVVDDRYSSLDDFFTDIEVTYGCSVLQGPCKFVRGFSYESN